MSLENTWQEVRDHSFIQNLSRSFRFTAPWRCFFSSVHLTHFLQGSSQKTGIAMAEAWFCAQWFLCWFFVLVQPVMIHFHGFFSCSPAAPSTDQRALYIFLQFLVILLWIGLCLTYGFSFLYGRKYKPLFFIMKSIDITQLLNLCTFVWKLCTSLSTW